MKKIVVFASGSGTNTENIILYFSNNPIAKVVAVFCNNPQAKVLEKANKLNVPTTIFAKDDLNTTKISEKLHYYQADLIVLAGFLLKFPAAIIKAYPHKIINIHPALLPKYGGKGMYGMHVHQAVLDNKEATTGISIHYVNEHYDEGGLIFQKNIAIDDCASAEAIAAKIHQLELANFPQVIERLLDDSIVQEI